MLAQEKPRIGQGRAGLRRRKPLINQPIAQSAETSKETPEASKIEKKLINQPDFTIPMQSINNTIQKIDKDISFSPDPSYRPPPKPVKIPMSEGPENIDISLELNTKFKENSLFQDGVILETYQRPDKSFLQNLKNWKV